MDRIQIEYLLKQLNNEKADLQSRLTVTTKATDSLQALLEMTPDPREGIVKTDSDAGRAAETAGGSGAGNVEAARPAPRSPRRTQGRAGAPPKGKKAARRILESDTSRFWNVREVSDEQVRRGWAKPRPRNAKGNPPARIALMRLYADHPENVLRIDEPVFAFKWIPEPPASLNGSGVSYAGHGAKGGPGEP